MYEQMSSLRYIEKRLSPLLPIFEAHRQFLGMLQRMNCQLAAHGNLSQELGSEFAVALDSFHIRVQSFESNANFLLARIASTIQTVVYPYPLSFHKLTFPRHQTR